jgi:hypothetical protein
MKQVFAGIGIFIVVVGLVIGCWFGYWAIARKSVSNQYDVNTHNQQYQAGLIAQERDLAQGWNAATDPAQRSQISQQFCAIYDQLKPPTADLTAAYSHICIGE